MGPRATGKTFLIEQQLSRNALIINLLHSEAYLRLSDFPPEIEGIIDGSGRNLVVIDEIHKIPMLLNELHRLIESKNVIFLLIGSSARKLHQKCVNCFL